MRPRSVLSACEYRPAIAATNSSRAAMLIRLIPDPADEHRSGANQMRQWLSFQEHSRRGNARDKQMPVLIVALGRRSAEAAFAFEGGAAAVALDVHLEDRGVVDQAIDVGQRH